MGDDIKTDLKVEGSGFNSLRKKSSGGGRMGAIIKAGEPSDSIQDGELAEQLSDHLLLRRETTQ
jgi:hypothetical protein